MLALLEPMVQVAIPQLILPLPENIKKAQF